MNTTLIIAGSIGLILFGSYGWYASLIRKRNKTNEALSGIDVQLRKRFNLIPNVLKIANRFMEHEKQLMEEITELRARAMQSYDQNDPSDVSEHLQAAGALQPAMMHLFAVSENYPELRSHETMLNAQHTYAEVEAHIAAARRAYNSAATRLKNSVQIFPGNIIAAMAGVKVMPLYEETEAAALQPIDAGDYLR